MNKQVKYFKLSTSDSKYKDIIAECEKRHKEFCPDNELSVRLTDDKETALVKVVGADPEWCVKVGLYTKSQEEVQAVDKEGNLIDEMETIDVYTKEDKVLSEYSRTNIKTFVQETGSDANWNPSLKKEASRE